MGIKFNPLIFGGFDLSGGGPAGAVQWKQPVADEASLPIVGNTPGDARVVLDTDKIYVWDDTSSKWVDSGLTVAAFGSTPNADGITLSSITVGDITRPTINLEPADATNPGAVSTTTQTFAGDKTFNDDVAVVGEIDAQSGVGSSNGILNIGLPNTTSIEIGANIDGNDFVLDNLSAITNTDFYTTSVTTNDSVSGTLSSTTVSPGNDGAGLIFTNPGHEGSIVYTAGGNLNLYSTTSLTVDSPNVDIGQVGGTTDIVGTVTIEYNPADPTDWAPAPDDVIEAIDQLADRFVEQDQVTKEPTGFVNRTDSTLTFSDSAPASTFTITPVGSFDFYVKGKKFTKTSAESIVISATAGDHYIYYDDTGVLQESTDPNFVKTIIQEYAYVAVIYWNTDTNTHTYFGDERHGLVMDGATHGYLHTVFGARFLSGLALQNFNISTGYFNSDQGTIRDEDIVHTISNTVLSGIPILYREGSQWRKKPAGAYPLIYPGSLAGYAGATIPYNQYTGGAWQLTAVQNNKYVLIHFFATNDLENGVIGIQGIAEYNSIETARTAANTEITSLSGLPFTEFVPIGTVLFETNSGYASPTKGNIIVLDGANYIDFRGTQLYTPAGTATTHGLLSGLGNDDHFQYLLADGTRAMGGALDMGTHQINNVVDPTLSDDAATKNYVDTEIASAITGTTSYFAGFDPTTGILTEVPGYVFYDDGSLEIGAQNSITIPSGINDYISIGISPTVANPGLNNLSGVQLNSPINETVANYNGFQVFGYGTNKPNNFTAYRSNTNYTGVGTDITHFTAGGGSDCTGTAKGFEFNSAGDAGTIQGVALYPAGNATTIEGLVFQLPPTGTYTNATGIRVDLSSATITNRPVGLDISGGTLGSTTTFDTVSNFPTLVDSCNIIRPVFEVQSLSPISNTDVLMTNLAGFMDFKDDHSGTGLLDLGVASVGFVSQVAVDATKTADSISMCLAGLAVDTTSAGGSVTDAHLYRGSAFTFGGSLTIDNLYGLKIENTLSDKATNSWGISVEDTGAENYLAKSLKIGGSTATTNNEIALEIGSNKSIRVGLVTQAQRTALANLSGLVVYDTDLNKFFGNDGSQWIQLNLSVGDIDQTTFGASGGQSLEDVDDFVFSNAVTRGFDAIVTIDRSGLYAEYSLKGIQKGASWEMSQEYVGDDTGITFNITSGGQIQYSSTAGSGATINFRAKTV